MTNLSPATIRRPASGPGRGRSAPAHPFRIAIIGCGPRGLYCLERLTRRLQQLQERQRVSVTIYEPAEFPGAGVVYHPGQPDYLRMNFAARYIDAWLPAPDRRDEDRCLLDWMRHRNLTNADMESYVPRATVGAYLHDCFCRVRTRLSRLPCIQNVTVVPESVTDIQPGPSGVWQIRTLQGGTSADEVLLTVGHEGWREATTSTAEQTQYTPVFPTEVNLSPQRLVRGATVSIRGFGLTAIDAILALTEGRGGTFFRDGVTWRYERSGREPECIWPSSRTGRPMLAKPLESQMELPSNVTDLWEQGCDGIRQVQGIISPKQWHDVIWQTICQTASDVLMSLPQNRDKSSPSTSISADSVDKWFQAWCDRPFSAPESLDAMTRSYEVATGQRPPDIPWALGETWRKLYPGLVDVISHGGLSDDGWAVFQPIASELERIAFGPPAENLGRILTLIRDGLVKLGYLTSGELTPGTLLNGTRRPVDYCIDAVLPSARDQSREGPLAKLIDRGMLSRLYGRLGVHVDQSGRPVVNGRIVQNGLAVIGRPAEGCIIGNDTLSRQLHPHPEHWASSVVQRIITREHRA